MPLAPCDVTVIIPVINESACLASCIQSARNAGAEKIIVVDGGSTDGSVAIACELGSIVVESPMGRGIQQHLGAERAETSLLCFLHADCQLSMGALTELCKGTDGQQDLYACFHQKIKARGLKYRLLEWGNALRVRWLRRPYGDQGICVSTDLYWRIGGFAQVPLMEDVLLAEAMKQIGILPRLIRATIEIAARRWQRQGVIRQTLRNWRLLYQFRRGKTPAELAVSYQRDDQQRSE